MLKFSKEEAENKLEWEHSKEFEFSGVMYDVVYKRIKSDSVFYWCWKDVKETELNYKLTQLVEKAADTNNTKSENLKLLSNLLAGLFTSGENPFNIQRNVITSTQQSYYLTHYISIPKDPLVPPPQVSSTLLHS